MPDVGIPEGISLWDSKKLSHPYVGQGLKLIINELGDLSAVAQNLKRSITTLDKLRASDHSLLLYCQDSEVLGYLKMGQKHLFIVEEKKFVEIDPFCCLDFYVREQAQRQGIGKALFEEMLKLSGQNRYIYIYSHFLMVYWFY